MCYKMRFGFYCNSTEEFFIVDNLNKRVIVNKGKPDHFTRLSCNEFYALLKFYKYTARYDIKELEVHYVQKDTNN